MVFGDAFKVWGVTRFREVAAGVGVHERRGSYAGYLLHFQSHYAVGASGIQDSHAPSLWCGWTLS